MRVSKTVALLIVTGLFPALSTNAQLMDNGHKVDTLSLAERIALRTNAFDWALLTPNIGVEYDLQKTNWGHWALTADFRYNWESSHTFKPGIVYNIAGARLGVKYYYRMRPYGTARTGYYPPPPR